MGQERRAKSARVLPKTVSAPNMFDASFKELVLDALFSALLVIPAWKIFIRAGLSPYFSVVIFVPYIGFMLVIAMLAFMTWRKPTLEEGKPDEY